MKYFDYYLSEIIPFLLIAFAVILIVRLVNYKKTKTLNIKREVLLVIFYLYLTALFLKTVVPKEFLAFNFTTSAFSPLKDIYIGHDFYTPFAYSRKLFEYGDYFTIFDLYIVNLIMFIPFGFLFPILYPKQKSKTLIIGIIISVTIEFLQMFIPRTTDLYDIYLNTLSVIIGYLLYLLYQKIKSKIKVKTN